MIKASSLVLLLAVFSATQERPILSNSNGLQVLAVPENSRPSIRIVLPRRPISDRSIEVLFPEHVTAVGPGNSSGEQLYLFSPGVQSDATAWRVAGQSLEYERDLRGGIHLKATAILEDDGVRFRYEFTNRSAVVYSMITAVTDPRLTGSLHDTMLERTYVHHADGFDLLASETPGRLTMPPQQWLPLRYLASYTWPVPELKIEKRTDGITYYNKSRPVDIPMVATVSADKAWVVASFSRDAGNVWSNPELTCQHVDPQSPLPAGGRLTREVKMLVIQGSLDAALDRVRAQRDSLR
jgi:hypothetical protein